MDHQHQQTLDKFRTALATAKTQADCDDCFGEAWASLPMDAAEANSIVVRELARRREELRRK